MRRIAPSKAEAILKSYRNLVGNPETADTVAVFSKLAKEYGVTEPTVHHAIDRAKREEKERAFAKNMLHAVNGEPIDYSAWAGKIFELMNGVLYDGEEIKASTHKMIDMILERIDKQTSHKRSEDDEQHGFDQDEVDSPV